MKTFSERNLPLAMPSRARGRIAAVEPSKRTRGHHTDKQSAHTHGDDVIGGAQIEISHTGDEKVGDDVVPGSPILGKIRVML